MNVQEQSGSLESLQQIVFICKNLFRIICSHLKSLRTKFDGTSEDKVDSSPPAVYVLFVIYSILTVQKV